MLDRNGSGGPRKGTLGFTFAGDASRLKSKYTVGVSMTISSGAFPAQWLFTAESKTEVSDSVLTEDVSTVRAEYKAYIRPWLETFGFIERFNDTYLGIAQRYEVGPGLKVEWVPHWLHRRGRAIRDSIACLENLRAPSTPGHDHRAQRRAPSAVTKALREALGADSTFVDTLADVMTMPLAGIRKQNAILAFGLSSSIFGEAERLYVDTFVDTSATDRLRPGASRTTINLHATGRYRLSLRPSFDLRPSATALFRCLYYVKLPLTGPCRPDGRLDYRTDLVITGTYTPSGADNVAFAVQFTDTYYNVPPRVPADVIASEAAAGRTVRNAQGPARHQNTTFGVKLSF